MPKPKLINPGRKGHPIIKLKGGRILGTDIFGNGRKKGGGYPPAALHHYVNVLGSIPHAIDDNPKSIQKGFGAHFGHSFAHGYSYVDSTGKIISPGINPRYGIPNIIAH